MQSDFSSVNVLVTGATSQIGRFLLPRLQSAGFSIIALSRRQPPSHNHLASIHWQRINLMDSPLPVTQSKVLFHIAPLPLLPPLLTELPNDTPLKRIIAFSSTSCFTKAQSTDSRERAIATQLQTAETALIECCHRQKITWTLFRPTLIYGCGQDKNVTFIAQFIRQFGFFPILGSGTGLRQPVHADDLARACVQACWHPSTYNQAYNLSGGQTLRYRDMVEAIFDQLGRKPRILSIPNFLFHGLFYISHKLRRPYFKSLSMAMIVRMNQDLYFDHSAARHDFGYCPRVFRDNDMGF